VKDNPIIKAYKEADEVARKEFFLWLKTLRYDFKYIDEILKKEFKEWDDE